MLCNIKTIHSNLFNTDEEDFNAFVWVMFKMFDDDISIPESVGTKIFNGILRNALNEDYNYHLRRNKRYNERFGLYFIYSLSECLFYSNIRKKYSEIHLKYIYIGSQHIVVGYHEDFTIRINIYPMETDDFTDYIKIFNKTTNKLIGKVVYPFIDTSRRGSIINYDHKNYDIEWGRMKGEMKSEAKANVKNEMNVKSGMKAKGEMNVKSGMKAKGEMKVKNEMNVKSGMKNDVNVKSGMKGEMKGDVKNDVKDVYWFGTWDVNYSFEKIGTCKNDVTNMLIDLYERIIHSVWSLGLVYDDLKYGNIGIRENKLYIIDYEFDSVSSKISGSIKIIDSPIRNHYIHNFAIMVALLIIVKEKSEYQTIYKINYNEAIAPIIGDLPKFAFTRSNSYKQVTEYCLQKLHEIEW